MEKKLQQAIDSIKLPSREYIHHLPKIISRNARLQNPENNFEFLRNFLADNIEFLKVEIAFTQKYSSVYHSNVPLSRQDDIAFCQQLLNILSHYS
ncbi:MAG: hypothetical protein Q7S37_02050 [bacterium]|nr:hypothetical protein [bacterium]